MSIIEKTCGVKVSVSYARQLPRKLGYGFRKLQPIPGKADADRQAEWIKGLQPIIDEAKAGKRKLFFMDAGQVKAFLVKVRNASGDSPVSIMLDNARYQHCNAVKKKAAELNIELIFLPSYSPNLNIIERL